MLLLPQPAVLFAGLRHGTQWLIISCSSQEQESSEGRGIFGSRSYQANLRLFPLVGRSLTWSLFWSSLIGDIGRRWEMEIGFLVCKSVMCWISGSGVRPSGGCVCVHRWCPAWHALTLISILLWKKGVKVQHGLHSNKWDMNVRALSDL